MPELRFGVEQGDPAEALFVAGNFPGASTAAITNARRLYAVLTGRVSEIRGVARLNEDNTYEYLGQGTQLARQREFGFWAQDSWRLRPDLSLNVGLRYELQMPFVALNNSYSTADYSDVFGVSGTGNLFKPGTMTGKPPTFHQLEKDEQPYPMDWNNVAPSIGAAWSPTARDGFLRTLTGDGSLWFAVATRCRLAQRPRHRSPAPSVTILVSRSTCSARWHRQPRRIAPVLLRDTSRLGPGEFPQTLSRLIPTWSPAT